MAPATDIIIYSTIVIASACLASAAQSSSLSFPIILVAGACEIPGVDKRPSQKEAKKPSYHIISNNIKTKHTAQKRHQRIVNTSSHKSQVTKHHKNTNVIVRG